MAGAFGALGGDLTSISINPAGSSVFLYSEIGGTLTQNTKVVESNYFGNLISQTGNNQKFDQVGAVFVFNNSNIESQWTKLSVGINSHRVSKFDQNN